MNRSDYLEKSKLYKGFHYSEIKPEMLEYLHRRTVEMFREVVRILDSQNIKYMLVGGTLLGAVTLKKFIPWDDDFDICVFEEDYEKMKNCLISELPSGMFFQCEETEPNYYLDWGKVRDLNSKVYPDIPAYSNNGVWIDIYPLKKIPEKEVSYRIAKANLDYLERRYNKGGLSEEDYLKRIHDGQLIEKTDKLKHNMDLENREGKTTENVFVIWSASKKIIRSEWIEPLTLYEFEGMKVWSMCNADAYLQEHYGSAYRVLPEDEDRRIGIIRVEY